MLEKAKNLAALFDEMSAQLADPSVFGDSNAVTRISRERAKLEPMARLYGEYVQLQNALDEARAALCDPELGELAQDEIDELEVQIPQKMKEIEEALLPKDEDADRNVIMEIRGGAGGEEAALWAADLFRMYGRYAEGRGWKLEPISTSEAEMGGLKEVVFSINGLGAWEALQSESGVHRVQRVPATEQKGRIHTSAATVAVLPEAQEIDIDLNPNDIREDTMRANGAGGQSVQKNETAIRLTYLPTGMIVICQDERSLRQNREKAMTVLRSRLYEIERQKQAEERDESRRAQVKSGDRSDKIRTYNYAENRLTDHRINWKSNSLDKMLQGEIGELIGALVQERRAQRLGEMSEN
ncbi:bacterial peptide chain release factor 1 (bRF-1) [Abditibacterium utsteinense]|uniref:Peptide chain release factor 1 n=1 Tax=Abditibacterium utsteinense TaxID=1960156 RepID=A0A2S8SQE8_9BACT|nr:peptide chain release factor 1 [Abditibacterium utsteinense]PQV63008.1 bacterial peptide chain release factor 1 (bRF-1) [Abditibacterium utsteinense]